MRSATSGLAAMYSAADGESAVGTTTLTRIPYGPHSRAATRDSPRMASLAMA